MSVKMSIVLDSNARVVAASKPSDYQPAKAEDEPMVTAGLAAGAGQSLVEVEVPADVAGLSGSELLSRLAEQPAVQTAIASSPTTGQGPSSGGPETTDQASLGASQDLTTDVITSGQV